MSQHVIAHAAVWPWTADLSVGLRGAIRRAVELVHIWHERAYERRLLAAMSERLCKDIGLSNVDLWNEVNKPFWRG